MRKSSFVWSSRDLSVKRNLVQIIGTGVAEVVEEAEVAEVDTPKDQTLKMK